MHAVLHVGAADGCGALGAKGDRAPALVVEREHLLLDDVGGLPHPALEQLGGLEDRGLERAVAGALERLLAEAQQPEARAAAVGQHVEGAARRLDLLH